MWAQECWYDVLPPSHGLFRLGNEFTKRLLDIKVLVHLSLIAQHANSLDVCDLISAYIDLFRNTCILLPWSNYGVKYDIWGSWTVFCFGKFWRKEQNSWIHRCFIGSSHPHLYIPFYPPIRSTMNRCSQILWGMVLQCNKLRPQKSAPRTWVLMEVWRPLVFRDTC